MPHSSRGPGDAVVDVTPARSEGYPARGTCAERSTGCDAPATGRSGCRVRAPAPPAVGCRRSGSCDCIPMTPAKRGLVVGGCASASPRPRRRHPHSGRRSRPSRDEPTVGAVRARRPPWHRPVGSTRAAGVSSGLTGGVIPHPRRVGGPRSALRSRDRVGRAVPRGVPPAFRAIIRDPTCTACRGSMASAFASGGGGRRPTTGCLRGAPCVRARTSRTEPSSGGATLLHHTAPGRAGVRAMDPRIRDAGRSSPGPRCTDSGVMCVIARIEPGSTAVPRPRRRRCRIQLTARTETDRLSWPLTLG